MIVIESQYFPPIEFFALIKSANEITIDGHEHFVKQTYRNRCSTLGSNGLLNLGVPLRSVGKKIVTSQMKIDYSQKWLNNHWRALIAGYNKSPFFEYYADPIHDILFKKHDNLIELNSEILTFCLKALTFDTTIIYSNNYIEASDVSFVDYRSSIHPKRSYTDRKIYLPQPYGQVFGSKFVSNLSILDLLFCEGPKSTDYF